MYGKNTHKGAFKPKNPEKYRGDPTKIIYRSSWELKFMNFVDKHPSILEWSSEETVIPYVSPVDNRWHRYFPDFVIKKKDVTGKVSTVLIEIKPRAQTIEPVRKTKINKAYINEVFTWGVNSAKWEAARKLCKKRGWDFEILTEKELNIKY
jgi:hypothetical protein